MNQAMPLAVRLVLYFVPMVLSLTVHECAHALSAHWLGDDTAKERGRLTLNPLPHIDPIGTLLLPALLLASGGGVFGWAKPTPINPAHFRRSVSLRLGISLTAVAGPISNLALGLVSGIVYAVLQHAGLLTPPASSLLVAMMSINAALAIFNLLPIPPLDGSRVVFGLLPRRLAQGYAQVARFGMILLFVLFMVPTFSEMIWAPIRGVTQLFLSLANL
jgi:Zn-dependent protease